MYLDLLKKYGIKPNFWCSEEYWEKAGWKEVFNQYWAWVEDENKKRMLPTLSIIKNSYSALSNEYWADFSNTLFSLSKRELLDYEFIYEPIPNIEDLPGKKWKTTRKNIHRVQKQFGELEIKPIEPIKDSIIENFIESYLPDEELYDPEVMIKYLLYGKNRKLLVAKNTIMGIIVWDENFKYINFRYCVVKEDPGLSDYARILFRKYIHDNYPGKLINDGGSLDKPSLYKYKERLCPLEINKIWTLQKEE
jgi:hypothetical protein